MDGTPRLVDGSQSRRIVERCDALQRVNLRTDGVVDQHGIAEACPAVHDSVRNGLDPAVLDVFELRDVLDVLRLVDEAELQAR